LPVFMENNNNTNGVEEIREETSKKLNKKIIWTLLFIFIFVASSVSGAFFGFVSGGASQIVVSKLSQKFPKFFKPKVNENSQAETIRQQIVQEDSAVIDVVEKSSPSVVSIVISKNVSAVRNNSFDPFSDDFFSQFFGDTPQQNQAPQNDNGGNSTKQTIGMGTGFFVTADGMIVTNKHVVDDAAADYTVMTPDGKEYSAKILAKDPINDIAIVKIDGNNFPVLKLGDSENLKIGQTVIAIGNSLGEFSNTVSKGIVSGLKRKLTASSGLGESENLSNIIQTDAAINLGNSGGPLLNISGEVIGVNVAKAQGAENIGFAIPSNQIKKIVDQVKTNGKISTPYIGVRYIPIDAQIQKDNSLPYSYGALILRGAKVTDFAVIPGSPGDKAGLTENDIILEMNGTKVDDKNDLISLISKYNVGDEVTLKIWHKGTESTAKLRLEERK
jgi:serine protease Do